ncbi:type IX secretion system membrane protein PorP/SprF [Rhodonellum sp.]|uniref:PorP/SprF family type IX secretion system membrane protein n=1 Tax=Rhodonellum sp. TaxID=2231180 RepID=UPI0027291F73|nr:type IX secretion system membrane protein PorP/SprF [Rhodonellum sp.]MDO9552444.1 type IX secretion system membrane protein PorP/SprF [Rhodonellum sp.]
MKNTLRILGMILSGGMFFTSTTFGQQLPQFSQYVFNNLQVNPGYAGYKGQAFVQSTYRSQWVTFPGAPKTFSVVADLSAKEGLMGFGFSLVSDQIGPTGTTTAMLTYAYRIRIGQESFLSLGVSGGASEYVLDGDLLMPGDADDPDLPQGRTNIFTPNMNAGLFFNSNRFFAGFSTFNMVGKKALEREDIALAYHSFHFFLTAGALIPLSENVQFKPSFLIKEVKGIPTNYDLNTMFLFMERLWIGASYRSNLKMKEENLQGNLNQRKAIAFLTEIFATEKLRIGYAYDHNLSEINNYRDNSHEFSLGFFISPKKGFPVNGKWF